MHGSIWAQGASRDAGIPGSRPRTTLQVVGSMRVPWTISINPGANSVAISSCQAVYIDLLDESGKDIPRNPTGARVSMKDFDWTATNNAAVGKYEGASWWAVCACAKAIVGSTIHITAAYPARSLSENERVAGLAFRSSITLPVAAAHGTYCPPSCEDALATTLDDFGTLSKHFGDSCREIGASSVVLRAAR